MLLYVVACCWELLRKFWNRPKVKPAANGRNNSQHCWAKNVWGLLHPFASSFNYLKQVQGARSIQPKFRPVRLGKVIHLKRWTSFVETFPVGSNRSIEFWTEISGDFGWMDCVSQFLKFYQVQGCIPCWSRALFVMDINNRHSSFDLAAWFSLPAEISSMTQN